MVKIKKKILEQTREGKIVKCYTMYFEPPLHSHWLIPSSVSYCRLLSEPLLELFNTEDPSLNNSGDESFSSTRERSVSEPNVFRSRIISANAPLVSLCCSNCLYFLHTIHVFGVKHVYQSMKIKKRFLVLGVRNVMLKLKALANKDTLLLTQMFLRLPARATSVVATSFVSGTQMFLILLRNILCL